MPYKDKTKQLEAQRRFYARNSEVYKNHKKRRIKEARQFMITLKTGQACVDCGIVYPHYVLEYDHLPEKGKKVCHPANLPKKGWGMERLQAELDKCELVCANCHRERTYSRRKKMG